MMLTTFEFLAGLTPLSHATMAEQLDSVKLLVKVGASINAQDNLGRTCLAMAAYQVVLPFNSFITIFNLGSILELLTTFLWLDRPTVNFLFNLNTYRH